MNNKILTAIALVLALATLPAARATETENLNMQVLPAPGKVVIDGKTDDWDLSGGVFVCGDVEHQRDQLAVWIHAMYDAENLYVLARWRDETPLSNPGLAGSDHSWDGDSLQLRIIADPERQAAGKPIICWANAWRDRTGKDTILRSHWSNQATGLVADEVYELMLEPKNWGRITFE